MSKQQERWTEGQARLRAGSGGGASGPRMSGAPPGEAGTAAGLVS